MRNAKPYHSKIYHSCHSEALAEEFTLLCHSERSEESKIRDSIRDVSASLQHDKGECSQYDKMVSHSELHSSEESHSIHHSEDFPPCHFDGCKPEEYSTMPDKHTKYKCEKTAVCFRDFQLFSGGLYR